MTKYRNIDSVLELTKALSDKCRLRALLALRGGELCVCQITELLGLAPSTASKHMSILRHAGLVESRKAGRWMYYRLPPATSNNLETQMIRWVFRLLIHDRELLRDAKRLKQIMETDPTVLCRKQLGA